MNTRRLLAIAFCIGAIVALMAMLSAHIFLHWSESVGVVDVSREQLIGLTPTQLNDKILSGAFPTRSVKGAEKAAYFITHEPITLVYSWLRQFVACSIAAFLGGWFFNRRRTG